MKKTRITKFLGLTIAAIVSCAQVAPAAAMRRKDIVTPNYEIDGQPANPQQQPKKRVRVEKIIKIVERATPLEEKERTVQENAGYIATYLVAPVCNFFSGAAVGAGKTAILVAPRLISKLFTKSDSSKVWIPCYLGGALLSYVLGKGIDKITRSYLADYGIPRNKIFYKVGENTSYLCALSYAWRYFKPCRTQPKQENQIQQISEETDSQEIMPKNIETCIEPSPDIQQPITKLSEKEAMGLEEMEYGMQKGNKFPEASEDPTLINFAENVCSGIWSVLKKTGNALQSFLGGQAKKGVVFKQQFIENGSVPKTHSSK